MESDLDTEIVPRWFTDDQEAVTDKVGAHDIEGRVKMALDSPLAYPFNVR
jgi:hypothetical protein